MRLPHHPELIDALRRPSVGDPWRVLLSGCLAGAACGVDGTDYGLGAKLPAWTRCPLVTVFPFCPEDHRLGTPRSMPDLHGGDLTADMLEGARAMLALARAERVDFALLTDRSGACGSQVISIGCRFEEPVQHRRGVGVAAALLLREGFHVVSQRDFASLERLRAIVEPDHVPDPEARDHHQHLWVLENLPLPD